jgi:hypothetical protein
MPSRKREMKGENIYQVTKDSGLSRYIIAESLLEALDILAKKEPGMEKELSIVECIADSCIVYRKDK